MRQVGEGVHHVPGLVEAQVSTMTEVWEVLQTGSNARAIGSTNANEHSSRSHWSVIYLQYIQSTFCMVSHGRLLNVSFLSLSAYTV